MLHVALLGRFEVRLNDEPIDVRLKPVQLLLAYLLLHRKKKIRREKLAGILWPDYTDASARKNLRNSIYRLRRAIGESFLVVDRTSVIFNTAAPFQLDVAQLQNMGAGGEIEELLYAAGLYQGELLPGSYEDWIVRERERVQADFERLMHKLLDQLVAAQRWEEVLIWSEHWIAQGQVPEPAYRSLMCAFAALGDRSSLAQTHRRVTQTLHNELGVAPGRRTQHLYRKLLAAEAVDADPLEEVHGAGVIEELATAGRMKLPLPATPMIGRRQELMQLQELITGAENGRLVCIVGPGGIGKSRLALETAKETAAHFADGARFVPLAAINNAQDLVTTISDHVGFTHSASDDPRQGLLNYLQRKKLLLILDNFEHLLSYADIVTDILQHALQVKLLCTSRERLNLDAEAVYMLSGLDYPVPEQPTNREPAQYGAIQLFLMRAALVQPDLRVQGADLDPVVRICHLVQGMPLALILAAGWLQMLTIEEVADEIASSLDILHSMARDLPQRQRSVRATFEYSWRLLSENDRHAFSRLALFRGGFSRQAAQHIASAPLPRLRRLVEKSLVVVAGPDRYQVHELLRQFAEEKLVAAGNDRLLRSTHSHYYLGEVAARVEEIKGKRQLESLAEIEIDIDNVRAAWEWALITEDWQSIDQAQESLSLFYYIQGRNREGYLSFRRVLESEPLSHSRSAYLDQIWGRLTARSGLLQSQLSAPDPELERELQDSLVVAQTHGLEREIAFGYLALGHYHTKVSGEYREALPCFEQAVDRYRALGDDYYLAHALHRLGYTHSYVTGVELFYQYTRQSLELARRTGNLSDTVNALGNLGSAALNDGHYDQAEQYAVESLALMRRMKNNRYLVHELILHGLGKLLHGSLDVAKSEAENGVAMAQAMVVPLTMAYGLAVLSAHATLAGDYERGRQLAADGLAMFTNPLGNCLCQWAMALACSGLDKPEVAWPALCEAMALGFNWQLQGMLTWMLPPAAVILSRQGQLERAAELLGLYFNHPRRPVGWAEAWPLLAEKRRLLENRLGPDGFRARWAHGRSLDLLATIEKLLDKCV